MAETTLMNLDNVYPKLPKKDITFVVTRRFKDVFLTTDQEQLLTCQLDVLMNIRKFTLKYLERTYGIKHLKKHFPDTQIEKAALISKIITFWVTKQFTGNEHGVKQDRKGQIKSYRYDKKRFLVHSASLQKNLVELLTNFGEYRKKLQETILHGSVESRKKYFYNQKGNNRQHHKAVHAGSLSYQRTLRSVVFPCTGSMKPYVKVVSNHQILLPDYGVVTVKENMHKMLTSNVRTIMLVKQSNGRVDVHVAIQKTRCRKRHNLQMNAVDWNLTNNVPYTDIYNHPYEIKDDILKQVFKLTNRYDQNHHNLSILANHGRRHTKRYQIQLIRLNKTSRKLSYVLDNRYHEITNQLASENDYLAVESLNYNQMVKERASKNQNKANRRFMIVKPARLHQLLLEACNRSGTSLIDVDCYKTSQMIYGTHYHCEKYPTSKRDWYSDFANREILRDQNSACNILNWALHPDQHIKVYERKIENHYRQKTGKKLLPKITGKMVATTLN